MIIFLELIIDMILRTEALRLANSLKTPDMFRPLAFTIGGVSVEFQGKASVLQPIVVAKTVIES